MKSIIGQDLRRMGLDGVDIENLRRHYAPALDVWLERTPGLTASITVQPIDHPAAER